MKKIVFYISGFGFGHLTRSIALLQELLRQGPDLHITVKCHSQHMGLVLASFKDQTQTVAVMPFDSGFTICFDGKTAKVDFSATLASVKTWLEELETSAEAELAACREAGYTLVISDIVPEAFFIAKKLGIPSIGISNFTWYELCGQYVGAEAVEKLKEMYQKASMFFEYPLSTGEEIPVGNRKLVGLVSRPQDLLKIEKVQEQYKCPGRLLLFLSVGGALNLNNVVLSPEIDYLYTRGIDLAGAANATLVPWDTVDMQNYVAACDGVITKCGWSTVAEALIAQKPLYLLRSRDGWLEERYMLQELAGLGVSQVIEPTGQLCFETGLFANIEELRQAYARIPERYTDQVGEIVALVLAQVEDGC